MLNIIIPIYRTKLESFEIAALKSIFKNLNSFTITFICPNNLSLSFLEKFDFIKNFNVERFDDKYFESINGYNSLLLDINFYERFAQYKYILICQTDAYVFKNDMAFWLEQDYDYIGAPWLGSKRNFLNITLEKLNNFTRRILGKNKKNVERLFKVGNGGFSLRKVNIFIHILEKENQNVKLFIESKPQNEYHIEDVFWSLYVGKKYKKEFKIPEWQKAISFCIDRKPKLGIKLNKNELPMACHGFNKPKVAKFWKSNINF